MADTGLFLNNLRGISDAEMIALAQRADALGYHSLWTGESWGRDAFTVLTMLACHTRSVRLGTGIVTVFSRTPAMIAQSIASLDLLSQGRAILGLGTSGRIVIEDWHGLPYHRPLARTREYVEIVRQALAGGPVNYQGDLFRLGRFRLGAPPEQQRIPIYLASLGPKNLRLTGEVADGWLPIWVHQGQLPESIEKVAQAATDAGRDLSQITVAPQISCWAADTPEDLAEGERLIRAHMAYYIGGMGSYYYNLFRRYGYEAEAGACREAWANGQREKAAEAISQDMVDNIAVLGDAASCRAKLDRFRRNGADLLIIAFPHGSPLTAIQRTIDALAPEPAGALDPVR
jgi:F420-dependent oxidoreductase-like protein